MCFGINFNNHATTPKIILLFDKISNPSKTVSYIPPGNNIEILGPDGTGGWDAFGITHTLKGNQCMYKNTFTLVEYIKYAEKLRRDPRGTKGVLKLEQRDLHSIMDLNAFIFKDNFGPGPYLQMMNMPYVNFDLIEKVAETNMATRYKRIKQWKPDPLLTFDVDKFRA